ncbi:DUF4905 domain-containing protein [Mucilaginibacter segetis]|uniref:DUF4905 domain-containing protein n=1 Tax=Mucilaginibacter segetis TaxID=2793071 RepID=A0A934UM64_9SPHI|nr:DUF4905 domain-containing protein [Mucilaginibacter segetis]MBK0378700.1 DUF4905 domain-containing protein [Mucilaginibacter segetis]
MLRSFINKAYEGTIWHLEFDELKDTLAIEIRNEQEKQVSFSSLELTTGDINFEYYKTPERWLAGIECVFNGVMLLHYYKHESGPEHKAIIAIDMVTQEELWSNYSIAFDHLTMNGPVAYSTNIQSKKLLLLDIRTGKLLRSYDENTDKVLNNSVVVPKMASPGNLIKGFLPVEPVGNMMHYLNHNIYRIVSLHAFNKETLQQHLFVMKGNDIVYHDLLNTDIQKLQPEAFVLHKNYLVYIKNKSEVKVINLKAAVQ